MNLVKLLTVGRSLNGGKTVTGNYKLQQISLPKFSSTARPSKAAAAKAALIVATKPVPIAAPVPVVPVIVPVIERSLETDPRGMDKTQKIPAGKILERKPKEKKSFIKTKLATALQRRIAAIKKRLFPVRSKKKPGATPTQAEWNLEKVTVARNDLSESDLEIVKPKVAGKTQSQKMHLPDLGWVKNSGREWVKATTRLFKTSSPFEADAAEKPVKSDRHHDEKEHELAERI